MESYYGNHFYTAIKKSNLFWGYNCPCCQFPVISRLSIDSRVKNKNGITIPTNAKEINDAAEKLLVLSLAEIINSFQKHSFDFCSIEEQLSAPKNCGVTISGYDTACPYCEQVLDVSGLDEQSEINPILFQNYNEAENWAVDSVKLISENIKKTLQSDKEKLRESQIAKEKFQTDLAAIDEKFSSFEEKIEFQKISDELEALYSESLLAQKKPSSIKRRKQLKEQREELYPRVVEIEDDLEAQKKDIIFKLYKVKLYSDSENAQVFAASNENNTCYFLSNESENNLDWEKIDFSSFYFKEMIHSERNNKSINIHSNESITENWLYHSTGTFASAMAYDNFDPIIEDNSHNLIRNLAGIVVNAYER